MTVHGERVFMLFRFHVKNASGSGAWSCAIFSAIVCTSDKLFIAPSPKYIKQSGLPCNSLHNPCKFLHIFFFLSPFSALPFPIFLFRFSGDQLLHALCTEKFSVIHWLPLLSRYASFMLSAPESPAQSLISPKKSDMNSFFSEFYKFIILFIFLLEFAHYLFTKSAYDTCIG